MEKIQIIKFKCSICEELYNSETEAKECESKPVSWDKGAKIGDIVKIIKGDGAGSQGRVTARFIYDRSWGHYAWKRYWHTVGIKADIIGGWGTRQLTFDDYEVIKPKSLERKRMIRLE